MEISLKQLRSLLKTLEDGGASEFEYQDDKVRMRLSMGRTPVAAAAPPPAPVGPPPPVAPESPPAPVAAEDQDADVAFITSPFVGTFYRAPSPDSDAFVEPGSAIKPGQTLCIVEAMKLMNEIEAEFAATVLEILAENGSTVEFGQRLFKVKRS
jgi:acetyl-CoA carboxylase biotin carboxyl carrier protein